MCVDFVVESRAFVRAITTYARTTSTPVPVRVSVSGVCVCGKVELKCSFRLCTAASEWQIDCHCERLANYMVPRLAMGREIVHGEHAPM